MDEIDKQLLFIVGSPRSGTTILGTILDAHSEISQWYEPYFMWDRYFRLSSDDVRNENDATPKVQRYVRRNFENYLKRSKSNFIVDKSPRNSLKIPFIKAIFPHAKFLHIVRDGRDTTLSIKREWDRRLNVTQGKDDAGDFDYLEALRVIKTWLGRQPFIYDRVRALWFETHGHLFNKAKHLNRLRWNGDNGWGPRYKRWEQEYYTMSRLQFNAMQWKECVESSFKELEKVEEDKKKTIFYEDFVRNSKETLDEVLEFVGVNPSARFYTEIPEIKKSNFNKWKSGFTTKELQEIRPIINPLLQKVGYLDRFPW